MHVTYAITPEDLRILNRHIIFRTPLFRVRFLIRLVIVPLVVSYEAFQHIGHDMLLRVLALAAMSVAWAAFVFWSNDRWNRQHVNQRAGLLGVHTIKIGADGILQSCSAGCGELPWSEITEIEGTKRYIYLFTSPRSALIVPKSGFSHPGEGLEFFRSATAYWQEFPKSPPNPNTNVWPPAPLRT